MICVEWISYEISAFVLGSVDEVQLGINAVIISILSMLAMVSIRLCLIARGLYFCIGSCWIVNISDNKSRE